MITDSVKWPRKPTTQDPRGDVGVGEHLCEPPGLPRFERRGVHLAELRVRVEQTQPLDGVVHQGERGVVRVGGVVGQPALVAERGQQDELLRRGADPVLVPKPLSVPTHAENCATLGEDLLAQLEAEPPLKVGRDLHDRPGNELNCGSCSEVKLDRRHSATFPQPRGAGVAPI